MNKKVMIIGIIFLFLYLVFYRLFLFLFERKYHIKYKKRGIFICNKTENLIGLLSMSIVVYLLFNSGNKGPNFELLNRIFLLFGMSILTITDLRKRVIPNKILLGLLLSWIGLFMTSIIFDWIKIREVLQGSILGMLLAGLIFFVCYLISKGNLGGGDVKLAFIIGLYLAYNNAVLSFFIASIICCCFSIVMIILKKIEKKDTIAFVPFLYLGVLFVLIYK